MPATRTRGPTITDLAQRLGFNGYKELSPVLKEFWGPDNPNFKLAKRSNEYLLEIADKVLRDRGHKLWSSSKGGLSYPDDAEEIKSYLIKILLSQRRNQADQHLKKRNRDHEGSIEEGTPESDDGLESDRSRHVHGLRLFSSTTSSANQPAAGSRATPLTGASSGSYHLRSRDPAEVLGPDRKESSNILGHQYNPTDPDTIEVNEKDPRDNESDGLPLSRGTTRDSIRDHRDQSLHVERLQTFRAEPRTKRVRVLTSLDEDEVVFSHSRQKRSLSPGTRDTAERRVRSTPYGMLNSIERLRSLPAQAHTDQIFDNAMCGKLSVNISDHESVDQGTQTTAHHRPIYAERCTQTMVQKQLTSTEQGTQTISRIQPVYIDSGTQTVDQNKPVLVHQGCQTVYQVQLITYEMYDRRYSINLNEFYHSMELQMRLCVQEADQGYAMSRNSLTAEGRAIGRALSAAFARVLVPVDTDLLQRGAQLETVER